MKKKLTTELSQFRKIGRMCDFGAAHQHRFRPGTPAAETLTAMASTVTELKAATASQASLRNRLREMLRSKTDARAALRDDIESLYETARGIAAKQPGFDDKFQESFWGDPKLLSAASSALRDAAPMADAFVEHALPPDFLEILKRKIQRFERAREEYARVRTACAIGQKTLEGSLRKAVAGAKGFDVIIKNTLRDDPAALTAWEELCRVRRR